MSKLIGAEFQTLPAWALRQRMRALEKKVAALGGAISALLKQLRTVRALERGTSRGGKQTEAAARSQTMKHTHVSDVMTTNVVTVHVDTPFKDVVETLARHNISGIAVVDDDGHVVGVVSEADLLPKEERKDFVYDDKVRAAFQGRRHRAERRRASGDTAGEVMNTPALTISPDKNLAEAARLLTRHKIKRLPVVDEENRLVGIVSRFDVLIPFLRSDDDIREEVVQEVVVRSLWESPRSVHVDVEDGVVTLSGRVELDTIVPVAVSLTQAVDGVVDVVNELTYARKAEKYPTSSSIPW